MSNQQYTCGANGCAMMLTQFTTTTLGQLVNVDPNTIHQCTSPLRSIWSSPMEAPMWFLCPFYSSASSGQWRSSAAFITPLRSALLKFSMQTQWMTTFSFTGFESAVLHSKGKTPCPLLPLWIVGGLCANLDVCISVEDSLTAFVKLSIQLLRHMQE